MPIRSYPSAIAWHAEGTPERPAIVHEDRSLSFAALDRHTNRLARAYAARGVLAGDLVTIALPNSIEFFAAALATW